MFVEWAFKRHEKFQRSEMNVADATQRLPTARRLGLTLNAEPLSGYPIIVERRYEKPVRDAHTGNISPLRGS
jgi:hypothetical protein